MATLYFIRHGQAGRPDDYDRLSSLGEMQALRLGEYFAMRGLRFDALISGGLRRQRETARLFADGVKIEEREIETDESWNEFDLHQVYRELAPLLARDSQAFANDLTEMGKALMLDPHLTRGPVGRCDRAVIGAWMGKRYSIGSAETWDEFRARIGAAWHSLAARAEGAHIAILTSATPIALCVGETLSLTDERIQSLMGVLYNSGVTTIRLRSGSPLMLAFNSTPHLVDSEMITFR